MTKRDPVEIAAEALSTIDTRLSEICSRLRSIEQDSADDAQASEEMANGMIGLSNGLNQVREAVVELGSRIDDHITVMQNFIDATREATRASNMLRSEVREKLKASSG